MDNLAKMMRKAMPRPIMSILNTISKRASEDGFNAYAVGGFVRDLILGRRNFDLDIVIEGNAVEAARKLASLFKGHLVVHKKFGTATIVMSQGLEKFKIDLATARTEKYHEPAALPTVEFSSIKDDLARRDFTINAMAVSLNGPSFGRLIDFFNSMDDLEKGVIRALHDASFIDDPTRIFRAVRFEQRFGFKIDAHTEYLIKNAIKAGMFGRTENQRIREEIILMLKEENPLKAVKRMDELDELRFLHPGVRFTKRTELGLRRVRAIIDWYGRFRFKKRAVDAWLVYLMALLEPLSTAKTREVCVKFVFRNSDASRLISCKKNANIVLRGLAKPGRPMPSIIYKLLEPLSFEAILFIMAKAKPAAKRRIIDFFMKYNGARLKVRGEDLKREGLRPGPRFKKILDKVLCAKLDGLVKTKADELEYARALI